VVSRTIRAYVPTSRPVAPAEIERRMAGRNLTRTLIDASQVATVIAFLASPLSVSINGESIACGGGTPGVIRY
jgi:enoyl-[acyl-carrier-protein] reductase (NADH)